LNRETGGKINQKKKKEKREKKDILGLREASTREKHLESGRVSAGPQ